jgi:hypothetical protein
LHFRRDFLQDYLMGRAVAEGVNPYLTIAELGRRFLEVSPAVILDHPSPHPPPSALLFLPLSLLDYQAAGFVWLLVGIISLAVAIGLIGRALDVRFSLPVLLAITVASLVWYPIYSDLLEGQVTIILLMLLAGFWLAWRRERAALAGLLLGLAIALKPVLWPVVVWLALRRDWRAMGAMVTTVLVCYAAATAVIGLGGVRAYFTDAAPLVQRGFCAHVANQSLASIGWRVFEGTGPIKWSGVASPPLVRCVWLAPVTAFLLPLLAVALACRAVWNRHDAEESLGLFLCVSILVSPVSWEYYRVLALIPSAQVILWLRRNGWPQREIAMALAVGGVLLISAPRWLWLALWLAGKRFPTSIANAVELPFGLSLLTLMPLVSVALLGWLVQRVTFSRRC